MLVSPRGKAPLAASYNHIEKADFLYIEVEDPQGDQLIYGLGQKHNGSTKKMIF